MAEGVYRLPTCPPDEAPPHPLVAEPVGAISTASRRIKLEWKQAILKLERLPKKGKILN